jgi:nucleoside 2-deoxyribosyltransferase
MKQSSTPSALAIVAGTLARAIDPRLPPVRREKPAPRKTVFFADNQRYVPCDGAEQWRGSVGRACARYGLEPEWPSEHFLFPNLKSFRKVGGKYDPEEVRKMLAKSPFVKIPSSIAMVAEISPFRGPHLNPMVAFEMGIAAMLDLPIFAWTTATYPAYPGAKVGRRPQLLQDRVWCGDAADVDGHWYDERFCCDLVENFDMVEYAVIAGNFSSLSVSVEQAIASCAAHFKCRAVEPAPAAAKRD